MCRQSWKSWVLPRSSTTRAITECALSDACKRPFRRAAVRAAIRDELVPEGGADSAIAVPGARSEQAVHPVHVSARHTEGRMMLADRLLVGTVKQAVNLAVLVVVQLKLRHAELVGFGIPRSLRDLLNSLRRKLQIVVEVHELGHDSPPEIPISCVCRRYTPVLPVNGVSARWFRELWRIRLCPRCADRTTGR